MGNTVSSVFPTNRTQFQNSEKYQMETSDYEFNAFFPEDLLLEILSFVPAKDLLQNCALVCKQWNMLIDSHTLWKLKCIRDKKAIPPLKLKEIPSFYYRQIYFYEPYQRNLIKNASGNDGMQMWDVIDNGGEGFCIEKPPNGADEIPKEASSDSCFATSYGRCTKTQMINLIEDGVHEAVLDNDGTSIEISEWHAGRFDCSCVYEFKVMLYDEDFTQLDDFSSEHHIEQWTGKEWILITHTFKNTHGVRHVFFEHSGQDSQFWAGHYGSKMTGASVKVCFK